MTREQMHEMEERRERAILVFTPEQNETFMLPLKTILLVFAFSLLWTYLGGMNGYYYQSTDWDCRNAIYFDLIQYKWPVTYDQNGAALVYYIGHWLPPAALAKLTVILDFHRNPSWGSMKKCLAAEQLLIEGALGMLSLCLRQGYPCVLYYQDENAAWTQFSADMPEQVATESVRLLRGGFRSGYALAQSPALPHAVVHLVQPVDMPGGRASTGTTTVWQINEEHRLIPLQS